MVGPRINLCGSHLCRFHALTGSPHSGQSFPDTPLGGYAGYPAAIDALRVLAEVRNGSA